MGEPRKQWVRDGRTFVATESPRANRLPAGLYDVGHNSQIGTYLQLTKMRDEPLLRFPDSPTDEVLKDIEGFWASADKFAEHEFPHKRGILMHGPPGSGKTCTTQLIARGVIEQDGVVIMWSNRFLGGYRLLRYVEPERPVVVMMEDIDSILEASDESAVLNVLDGAERMHRVVFVATTNYMEKLQARVTNRPSRFDRRIEMPHPGREGRRMYLETLMKPQDEGLVDLDRWARDTEGFSMAHLKELFVGVALLGNPYDVWLKQLKEMSEKLNSTQYGKQNFMGQYA
jgi:ATP-dependent 26S proteasome regulatory subunit